MTIARSIAADIVSIIAFVVLGRRTHDGGFDLGALARIAAPFLIALTLAWLIMQAWRRPTDWVVGIGIWALTLMGGMTLRNLLFDDGTAWSFVLVTAGFLAATMIGWRAATWMVRRPATTN